MMETDSPTAEANPNDAALFVGLMFVAFIGIVLGAMAVAQSLSLDPNAAGAGMIITLLLTASAILWLE